MTAKEMETQKERNPKFAKLDIDVLTYLLSRVLDLWKADVVICRDIAPELRYNLSETLEVSIAICNGVWEMGS